MIKGLEWEAEKWYYASIASGIIGRPVTVSEADGGELGYTAKGNTIFVARKHPFYEKMTEKEAMSFRYGVVVHESLHQVFTNFDYYKRTLNRLQKERALNDRLECRIFQDLANLVEDPAIENMASNVIGGPALRSLSYMIYMVDSLSGDFSANCRFPWEELFNALVQFGDLGILHGEFRFLVAKQVFRKISPMFYEAINETNSKKRIDMILPILRECRPLWSGFTKATQDTMLQRIKENSQNRVSSIGENSGNGKGSNSEKPGPSKKDDKRRKCLEKMEEEAQDSEGTGADLESCDGDSAGNPSGKDQKGGKQSGAGNGKEKDGDKASQARDKKDGNSKGSREKREANPGAGTDSKAGQETGGAEKAESAKEYGGPDIPASENGTGQANGNEEWLYTADLPDFTDDDANAILTLIEGEYDKLESARSDKENYRATAPSFESLDTDARFRKYHVKNRIITTESADDASNYEKIVDKMSDGISMLQDQLKEIFIQDRVYKVHTDSGRANLRRFASGKVTTRLFDRRRRPDQRMNMCVGVLGDSSGSMQGEKLKQEIMAIIALAETFAWFDIPFYFLGFNVTDSDGPTQTHYIRWDNTRYERERVLHMEANGNNFDSYSIRYMTNLLAERPEKHKIMFVLSDGLPTAYFSGKEGIRQNAAAISEARDSGIDVIGFGIGRVDADSFVDMYGIPYFLNVLMPDDIFEKLADKLTAVVSGWNRKD